ncbi:hypothetical protein [Evansella sp. LMS18]|nr:hypothetical protein [Evansella sp. LMS18]
MDFQLLMLFPPESPSYAAIEKKRSSILYKVYSMNYLTILS